MAETGVCSLRKVGQASPALLSFGSAVSLGASFIFSLYNLVRVLQKSQLKLGCVTDECKNGFGPELNVSPFISVLAFTGS